MLKDFLLLAAVSLASLGCATPTAGMKKWSGEWGYREVSIWLLPDGNFESREIPGAQSKPMPTIYLKGIWTLGKGSLTLQALQSAYVYEFPPRPIESDPFLVNFQTPLELEGKGKALICRQLHLTPSNFPDPRKFSYRLLKVHPEPLPNWAKFHK